MSLNSQSDAKYDTHDHRVQPGTGEARCSREFLSILEESLEVILGHGGLISMRGSIVETLEHSC